MEVLVDEAAGELELAWKEFGKRRYPFVWLRDCCQCSDCFHPDAKSRRIDLGQLDLDAKPRTVQPETNGDAVRIVWTDGHVSVFEGTWLRERLFGDGQQIPGVLRYKFEAEFWGSELNQAIPTITFDSILTSDEALYEWMITIEKKGICILTGAPTSTGQLHRIATRVAYLRKIHYGETFQVVDKLDPSNIAYTRTTLPLHTVTPYLDHIPVTQMLHCISQCESEGGENQFSDGFHVAEQLRKEHPEYFQLLSTVKVDYYDLGNDFLPFYMRARHYTIEVDENGTVVKVTYSNHGRDSVLRLPIEKVKDFYKALKTFYNLLRDKKNIIEVKLKPGEIICFNNHRVLHARSGYITGTGERHLEGGYIDCDEILSRRRIIERSLHIHDQYDHL